MGGSTSSAGSVEHEVKLAAWPGFELPDLTAVLGRSGRGDALELRPAERLELDAVYHDTTDLRLVRRGVSLRHRTGEGPARWTLKLPVGAASSGLRRLEIDVLDDEVVDARTPPEELIDLVQGWARGAPVGPVTRLRTRRVRHELGPAGGPPRAEIDDDEVEVLEGDRVVATFRELEVELLGTGGDDLLARVGAALRDAGAGDTDPTPKVARALGPRALAPPDVHAVTPPPADGVAIEAVVRSALAASAALLVDHDHAVRLDAPDGVHLARVGARRLRSQLGALGSVIEPDQCDPLREELRWLGGRLGAVRDADVLARTLGRSIEALVDPTDREAGARLLARLAADRRDARVELLASLRSDRYLALLDGVVDVVRGPRLRVEPSASAADLVPRLVRARWRRLRDAVEAVADHPADVPSLHRVRILAKRVRYAGELAVPIAPDVVPRFVEAVAELQDVLGEVHDATVAIRWLRELARRGPPEEALVAGELVVAQQAAAADARARWREAYAAADRKRLTGWMA
jgi:CHAD domain-containing protein